MAAPPVVPWITVAISAACTAAYAVAASGIPLPAVTGDAAVRMTDPLHIVGLGARSTPLVTDAGETWRLLSCHFVHTSWIHLIFNLAFLFAVGGAIEQVVRRADYAALILFTATVSALGSLLGTPQVSAGASGLVFGTLGAAVTLGLRHHQRLGNRVRRYFGLWVLPFLLVVFGFGIGNPSVDQASHLGGLVSGLVGGSMLSLRSPQPPFGASARWGLLLLTGALLAVVLLVAPLLARAGHPPHRIDLAGRATVDVPGTWLPASNTDHPAFFTAGGVVKLDTIPAPALRPEDAVRWYETHHATPELRTGTDEPRVERLWIRGRPVVHRIYRTWRNETPIQRDVYFLALDDGPAGTAIFAFETPWTWRHKYAATRLRILSTHRSHGSARRDPVLKMAALQ